MKKIKKIIDGLFYVYYWNNPIFNKINIINCLTGIGLFCIPVISILMSLVCTPGFFSEAYREWVRSILNASVIQLTIILPYLIFSVYFIYNSRFRKIASSHKEFNTRKLKRIAWWWFSIGTASILTFPISAYINYG